jgi:hypothetical protein
MRYDNGERVYSKGKGRTVLVARGYCNSEGVKYVIEGENGGGEPVKQSDLISIKDAKAAGYV